MTAPTTAAPAPPPGGSPNRRLVLQWTFAASLSPFLAHCASDPAETPGYADPSVGRPAPWPRLELAPVDAPGYGRDPDLLAPTVPWPATLSARERATAGAVADLILPAVDGSPAASEVGVVDFLDEWVSAPYPLQRNDRETIVPGLAWLDAETQRRFGADFADADETAQRAVLDTIAYRDRIASGFGEPARFFNRLRGLVLGGYYTRPAGLAELGYVGNTPILGPYPGPSEEARAHLAAHLAALGLAMPDA